MKKISVLVLMALTVLPCLGASESQAAADIHKVLADQVAAWNAGSIEGFMDYYWKSAELTFQSGAGRFRGWQVMLDRYNKNYAGEKRGTLAFSDLEVRVLAEDSAYVLGRWQLGGTAEPQGGVFTVILRKFPEGWRIIHDHTS